MASRLRLLLTPIPVALLLGVGFVSLFESKISGGPTVSLLLNVLDTRVILVVASAFFAVSLLLYLYSLRVEDPANLVTSGREVEALVPVYDEAGVMHRSVESLANSRYEDLTVTILTEPDDGATNQRAQELAARHDDVRIRVNEDRAGSKAGALNSGIERSEADVIAMFDSDQEAHPNLIPHGMAALTDNEVARVRSMPRPTGGLLESEAYYEYLLLFFLPQKFFRVLFGHQFVGTRSVLVERTVFEDVGLFAEDTLTEDLDFTHRCNQAGLSIRELLYYPSIEEPAHGFRDWWGQRVRWMTGRAEIVDSLLREWHNLLDRDFFASVLTVIGTFAAGIIMATFLPKLVLALATYPAVTLAALGGFYGVTLATRAVDNRTSDLDGFGLGWSVLPLFVTLYGLVIVQVIFTAFLGIETEWYQVEKEA